MEETVQKNITSRSWFMPAEEKLLFERAIARLPHPSISSSLSYKELDKHSKIYLVKHNLYHKEIQSNPISVAEIKISLQALQDLLKETDLTNVVESYLHLALLAVEENPNSVYVISEKVLLGEFVERGGLEPGIWHWKAKIELFPEVLQCLQEKLEKSNFDRLIERYQNLRIQELLPPLHL